MLLHPQLEQLKEILPHLILVLILLFISKVSNLAHKMNSTLLAATYNLFLIFFTVVISAAPD